MQTSIIMKQLSLGCNVTSANLIRCSMGATNGNSYISQLVESSRASSKRGGEFFEILNSPYSHITHISRQRESVLDNLNFPCSIYQSKLPQPNVQNFCGSPHPQAQICFEFTTSFLLGIFLFLRWCYWSFQRTLFHSLHLTDTSLLSYFTIHCKDLTIRKRWRRRRNTKPIY